MGFAMGNKISKILYLKSFLKNIYEKFWKNLDNLNFDDLLPKYVQERSSQKNWLCQFSRIINSWPNEKDQKNSLDRFRENLLIDGRTDRQTTHVL